MKDLPVAIYARVSTDDKDQNPDTQLLPLREFCKLKGWTVYDEYVDHASARDLRGRKEWRRMVNDAQKRKVSLNCPPKTDPGRMLNMDRV